MESVLVLVFSLLFVEGAFLWANGVEYNDPINTYNGKLLWVYGAVGLILCVLRVVMFG